MRRNTYSIVDARAKHVLIKLFHCKFKDRVDAANEYVKLISDIPLGLSDQFLKLCERLDINLA